MKKFNIVRHTSQILTHTIELNEDKDWEEIEELFDCQKFVLDEENDLVKIDNKVVGKIVKTDQYEDFEEEYIEE